jgi:hypothetical protein
VFNIFNRGLNGRLRSGMPSLLLECMSIGMLKLKLGSATVFGTAKVTLILASLLIGEAIWAGELQVADAYTHQETGMVLFRVERADQPRVIKFTKNKHSNPDVTEGPYPVGWYYYKPGSGIAYQLRFRSGEFWSIRKDEIQFHFTITVLDKEPSVTVSGKYKKTESGRAKRTPLNLKCGNAATCFAPKRGLNAGLTELINNAQIDLSQNPEVRTLVHVYEDPDGTLYIVDLNTESLSINNLTEYLETAQVMRVSNGDLEFLDVASASYEKTQDTRDRLWPGAHIAVRLTNGDTLFQMHPTLDELQTNNAPAPYLLSEGKITALKQLHRVEQQEALSRTPISPHRYSLSPRPSPCHLFLANQ